MEDLMGLLQFVLASPTAETPAGRLNYLQDYSGEIGFAPFGRPFEEQPFDADLFASQTRAMYATDPSSPYNQIFEDIDNGIDPESAARKALNSDAFASDSSSGTPSERREFKKELSASVLGVAKDYSRDVQTYGQEFRKHQNEMARQRAEAPVTFEELLNPNNKFNVLSEQLGRPQGLTTDDLADMYARSKGPKNLRDAPGGHRRSVRGRPAVANPLQKFRPGEMPGYDPRLAARKKSAFEKASQIVQGRLKSSPVYTPKQQEVLRGLSYMNLLGGQGGQ